MKITKRIILIIMSLLFMATIALQYMGAWMPIFSVLTGMLFIYYLAIYLLIVFIKKIPNKIIYLLMAIPFLLFAYDFEGLIDAFWHFAVSGADLRGFGH